MGQYEILEFLKKNRGKEYDAHQIAEALGINYVAVSRSLRKMYKYDKIMVILSHRYNKVKKYYVKYGED